MGDFDRAPPPRSDYVVGTCTSMCPPKELKLREKENLLHPFEMRRGTEGNKFPEGDPDRVIKRYRRSAAGDDKISPSDLRPFPVLMKTIHYMYTHVFPIHTENPVTVYNFMFDRLRSVRQDMVVQNLPPCETIKILEPIARFHIYFGYVLVEESLGNFDPYINNTHLQECLKRLLVCYDMCCTDENNLDAQLGRLSLSEINLSNRCQMEGAYLLFNLSHVEALERGSRLENLYIDDKAVKLAFAWYLKNYVRFVRLLKNLPPLLLCIASSFIPEVRKYCLQALSHAFSSSNSSYPVSHLKELLMYESESQLIDDCHHFDVRVTGESVNFLKKNFNAGAELVKSKRLQWIDRILCDCDIDRLLCYGSE